MLVVPGGGEFADLVRHLQRTLGLSDRTAHAMAIFGMNVFGYELHGLIGGSRLTRSLKRVGSRGCSIFLPFNELKDCSELESSWNVTSDSIAAWASGKMGCGKLVLVKVVDGIYHRRKLLASISSKKLCMIKQTVVDRKLPQILEDHGIACWVVNGRYPERVEAALEGERTTGTVISPEV
jgi:aspartokinase-like uncharacterized kinase